MQTDKQALYKQLETTMYTDRFLIRREIQLLHKFKGEKYPEQIEKVRKRLENSSQTAKIRELAVPEVTYPKALPISEKKDTIVEAIRNHQVVVITGETGSGKTTQLPKMCLEAGRGVFGKIACTQPRRIAATSLAQQVAKELKIDLGNEVGYKIRFDDKTKDDTLVQFMTDGVLLTELQTDRFLNKYDTIIIDEAHERTLNIDFLLGSLKKLLPKRPELKLIVTSATIDVDKFSEAFPLYEAKEKGEFFLQGDQPQDEQREVFGAPIIEVSGRMYPVELRYHPIDEILEEQGEISMIGLVQDAVEEILTESHGGDILVFMSGYQEIKEAAEKLRYLQSEGFLVLPLFGRLSNAEQNRIFRPTKERKIILATNIAETSITIPGIHYVVDTGRARISEYNTRSGTQGLPVKGISQSSANQRKGRCGRVANGVCIRLYSEEDFNNRPEYTTPEIQRSDLSEVILKMLWFKLGNIETFPFIDPPESAQIRAGFRTLKELSAISHDRKLTKIGRQMAPIPVNPRIARVIIQAHQERVLYPVLIIAAGISCQDPREWPEDKKNQASQIHAKFRSPDSDLMTLLSLWENYHETWDNLKTQNKMRKFCLQNFLSFRKMREWRDIHTQLKDIAKDKKWWVEKPSNWDYDAIHRSILAGYLTNIAQRKEKKLYQGTKNRELIPFPGSGQYKQNHPWIVATEIIETSQLFAHRIANINPDWLESLAGDLCKKSWSSPRYETKTHRVVAWEKVSLYGFTIVEQRKVNYGHININESTEIFIREALIEGKLDCSLPFWKNNRKLIQSIEEEENKQRKRNLLVDDFTIEAFYKERLQNVSGIHDLNREIKKHKGDKFLFMTKKDLLRQDEEKREDMFPNQLVIGDFKCKLKYTFEPGHVDDGVTLQIPLKLLDNLQPDAFEYLVPGLLEEKIHWLIKSLDKPTRIRLMPIQDTVDKVWEEMHALKYSSEGGNSKSTLDFYHHLSEILFNISRVHVEPDQWDKNGLPDYLKMNFSIRDPKTKEIRRSRDLETLQGKSFDPEAAWKKLIAKHEVYHVTTWNFGNLLEEVFLTQKGDIDLWGYKTLEKDSEGLKVTLSKTKEDAENTSLKAIPFLLELELGEELSWLYQELRFSPEALAHMSALAKGTSNFAVKELQNKFGKLKNKQQVQFHQNIQDQTYQMVRSGLFEYNGENVFSEKGYNNQKDALKKKLQNLGSRVVDWISGSLKIREETFARLFQYQLRDDSFYWQQLQQELDGFMTSDMLIEIPLEQWQHCPRLIRTYQKRAERYQADPHKEEDKFDDIEEIRLKVKSLWEKRNKVGLKEQILLKKLRWMMEELKVSVFAQELKTAFPVSPKRIEKYIQKHFGKVK